MKKRLLPRPLVPLGLVCLLCACASDSVAPTSPSATQGPAPITSPALQPAHLRELSGQLLGVPNEADAELALLVVDDRGIPSGLLGNITLRGNGGALPFRLPFNPDAFATGSRVELRGRASLSGRLIRRLPSRPIHQAATQQLGELHMVPAP